MDQKSSSCMLNKTLTGTITALFPPKNPTFGFICVPLLESQLFFHMSNIMKKDAEGSCPSVSAGLPVIFCVEKGVEQGKNKSQMRLQATAVRPLI
mmetsp:Transcript_26388/g.46787  ORF Transcript_26388/g.46787 Transcript_26388/m.46787 type:complete len:95 (+) Transcript_26388:1059-1343(+)